MFTEVFAIFLKIFEEVMCLGFLANGLGFLDARSVTDYERWVVKCRVHSNNYFMVLLFHQTFSWHRAPDSFSFVLHLEAIFHYFTFKN